jgi:hypothetical protein
MTLKKLEMNISDNITEAGSERIKKKILCSTNRVELRGHINILSPSFPLFHTHIIFSAKYLYF